MEAITAVALDLLYGCHLVECLPPVGLRLPVLVREVGEGVAHQTHHAELTLLSLEDGLNGPKEALQPVNTGDENALNTVISKKDLSSSGSTGVRGAVIQPGGSDELT